MPEPVLTSPGFQIGIQEQKSMLTIVKTADGSNTIYNSQIGENYHSKHGALQESMHVFIKSGLLYFLEKKVFSGESVETPKVSVLEVGFGTGLNFLLSANICTEMKAHLKFTGIEVFPLSPDMLSQVNYGQYIEKGIWQKFVGNYENAFSVPVEINPYCELKIANCPLLDFHHDLQHDIVYFDAFAVAQQPEMWDEKAISHTLQFLKPGGIFVTYAVTGNLKRILKTLGCELEKLPGAPGKREMLRAVKNNG